MSQSSYNDIYLQLKVILEGCDTIIDALPFCNYYGEKYPHMKNIICSYTNGKMYRDNIDIKTKQNTLYDVNLCDSRDDAYVMISKITDRTNDDVYKKTLERIANKKHYKKIDIKSVNHLQNVSKKCPHCSHIINMHVDTNYIICGYHNPYQGYDWNGCGRDWCFQCEKLLCKSWELNALHLQMNRIHDDECCTKHANENGYTYPDDYCQCNNMNVHRNQNSLSSLIE